MGIILKSYWMIAAAALTMTLAAGSLRTLGAQESGARSDTAAQAGTDEYVLGTNDVIRIVVEGHPEWSGDFLVKPDGTIMLRDVGDVMVKGQTREQFSAALTRALERLINNPRVTVDTLQYKSQVIYVLGEVNRPGEYPTQGKQLTLRDAVVLAGLPARFAATDRVYIVSPTASGKARQRVINLSRILYHGQMQHNIEIRPGEIVYIPPNILGLINNLVSAIFEPVGTVQTTTGVLIR